MKEELQQLNEPGSANSCDARYGAMFAIYGKGSRSMESSVKRKFQNTASLGVLVDGFAERNLFTQSPECPQLWLAEQSSKRPARKINMPVTGTGSYIRVA